MINLSKLEQYRENNRIEAKRALGGLPQSIWETYSAFANTLGGIILLGVEEDKDGSLYPIDLPDPGRLVRDFWEQVNDPRRTNVNILSAGHVRIQEADGKRIVTITIPRAQRSDRPVYIGTDPMTGTYRRNGEGDYRCTVEEIQGLLRDASIQTSDMKLLENMTLDALDIGTIRSYRRRMEELRPGHAWEKLDTPAFLCRLGAAGRGLSGLIHPTTAGLLFFGHNSNIRKVFPNYLLDYQEQEQIQDQFHPLTQIRSSCEDWSGNLYDFYFRVSRRLARRIPAPNKTDGHAAPNMIERTERALREALANCLINADYYGQKGISIIRRKDAVILSNPGDFRIEIEEAKSGGVSDPRGAALLRIFNMIRVSSGAGSGIPGIFNVWNDNGWDPPTIHESFNPDQITLTLPFTSSEADSSEAAGLPADPREGVLTDIAQKTAIIDYLTDHAQAELKDLILHLHLPEDQPMQIQKLLDLLAQLTADGIITIGEDEKNPFYRLRA